MVAIYQRKIVSELTICNRYKSEYYVFPRGPFDFLLQDG